MDEPGNDLTAFVLGGLVALLTLIGYFYYEDRTHRSDDFGVAPRVQVTTNQTDR